MAPVVTAFNPSKRSQAPPSLSVPVFKSRSFRRHNLHYSTDSMAAVVFGKSCLQPQGASAAHILADWEVLSIDPASGLLGIMAGETNPW